MSILLWFLSPIGRYVAIGLVVLSAVGFIYGKGRYDDHVAYTAKIEREAADAVAKANAASDAADKKFHSHPIARGPKPHRWSLRHDPDGFSRD